MIPERTASPVLKIGEAIIGQLKLGGQGSFSFIFSDINLVNFAETFFSIRDKSMRWIDLLTLAAFFMPGYSAIHELGVRVHFLSIFRYKPRKFWRNLSLYPR